MSNHDDYETFSDEEEAYPYVPPPDPFLMDAGNQALRDMPWLDRPYQIQEGGPSFSQQGMPAGYASALRQPSASPYAPSSPAIQVSQYGPIQVSQYGQPSTQPAAFSHDMSQVEHQSGYDPGSASRNISARGTPSTSHPRHSSGRSSSGRSAHGISSGSQPGAYGHLSPFAYGEGQSGYMQGYTPPGELPVGIYFGNTPWKISPGEVPHRSSSQGPAQVSAQPSPAARPPTASPVPHQHGGYGGAQHAGQYFSPQQQATAYHKRTHDHLSPSSQEGARRKGKQRQESPWSQQGGQGHASISEADDAGYNLTESPYPSAARIYQGRAGGGYDSQAQGESSAQGAAQQRDDTSSPGADRSSAEELSDAPEPTPVAQQRDDTSSPGADRSSAEELSDAPEPTLVPTSKTRKPALDKKFPRRRWTEADEQVLEDLVSGFETWQAAKKDLEDVLRRDQSVCAYRWTHKMKHRRWNDKTEDDLLRGLPAEPDNWEAFRDQYNASRTIKRSSTSLKDRFDMLRSSYQRYNIGNRGP